MPFRGKNFGEIFSQFSKSTFTRPSTLRDDIPPEVDRWFERAFKPMIAERFVNGEAMVKSLRHALLDRVAPSVRAPVPLGGHQPAPVTPMTSAPTTGQPAAVHAEVATAEATPRRGTVPWWALALLGMVLCAGAVAALLLF